MLRLPTLHPHQIQNRGNQVHQAPTLRDTFGRDARNVDDERHSYNLLPNLETMPEHPVLTECFPMIRRNHNRRLFSPRLLSHKIQEPLDLIVRPPHLVII